MGHDCAKILLRGSEGEVINTTRATRQFMGKQVVKIIEIQ